MTSGSGRSIRFHSDVLGGDPVTNHTTPDHTPPLPAIVIWGRMAHTGQYLLRQMDHLPAAADEYHSALRMILNAAEAIEADARLLLGMNEGGGS